MTMKEIWLVSASLIFYIYFQNIYFIIVYPYTLEHTDWLNLEHEFHSTFLYSIINKVLLLPIGYSYITFHDL